MLIRKKSKNLTPKSKEQTVKLAKVFCVCLLNVDDDDDDDVVDVQDLFSVFVLNIEIKQKIFKEFQPFFIFLLNKPPPTTS